MANNISMTAKTAVKKIWLVVGAGLLACLFCTQIFADVVIGDFENGSTDGWISPQESIASVMGKGNTLGNSSLGVTLLGGFWGMQSPNLVAHRSDFLQATFLSMDMTFIQADLQGGQYAQTKEVALHDSSGAFVQRQIATGAAGALDTDSLMPAATAGQWQGQDGTRTLKFNLNTFAAPSQATMGETTYKQYLANHPEITSFDIWVSCQSDSLAATYYFDNIKLLVPGDFDQNGTVNNNDVPAMLNALTDLSAYQAAHNNMSNATLLSVGDFNGDGKVTNADIQGLLDALAKAGAGAGGINVVPEPATCWLLAVATPGLVGFARRFRRPRRPRRTV
jgi:hypothetical protein